MNAANHDEDVPACSNRQ